MIMSEILNERIKVGAVFGDGAIKPKWFVRGSIRFDIANINYRWRTREGRNIVHHFSVSDGMNVFELAYSSEESNWMLVAAKSPGD